MITYHMIRWRNMLSTGAAFITVKLDSHEHTLIIGKNGQGKSQMLDAICFALFGRAFRKIKKGQIVNSINKKDMLVELALSTGGHSYVIRRGIKPNVFEIYKDKVLVPEDASTGDYQEYLERILGMNFKTFCQINIVGKATYVPFMDLPAGDRRSVVEDMLDSHVYSVMAGLAKAELKDSSAKIKDLMADSMIMQEKIKGEQRILDHIRQDNTGRIEELKQQLVSKHTDVTALDQKIGQEEHKLAALDQKLAAIVKDPDKVRNFHRDLAQQMMVDKSSLQQIDSRIERINRLDVCQLCEQKVDHSHKEEMKTKAEEEKSKFVAQITAAEQKKTVVEELLLKIKEITDEQSNVRGTISQLKFELGIAQEHVDAINKQIEKLSEAKQAIDTSKLEQYKGQLKQLTKQYDDTAAEIDVLKKCVEHLADDGIKAKIVNKYIPIINKQINYYLEKMDLFVQFELDEQFNETIKSRHRDVFSYDSFSEGEKLRINLALLLSWRHIAKLRNSVSSNLLIMDEVLDGSMDDVGAADFLSVLRNMSDTQNAFIISHKSSVIEGFDNIIVAEKVGNFTEYRPY